MSSGSSSPTASRGVEGTFPDSGTAERAHTDSARYLQLEQQCNWLQAQNESLEERLALTLSLLSELEGSTEHAGAVPRLEQWQAELEARLFHAQKMETVGMLTSGIAHDFNNVLAAILMQIEAALANPGATKEPALKEIRVGALRAKALVRRILKFSRRDEPDVRELKLGEVVSEVVAFEQRLTNAWCRRFSSASVSGYAAGKSS